MAEILNHAILIFPSPPIPKDTERRREVLEDLPAEISDGWEKLEKEFYEYPENLARLEINYVKANRNKFEE